MYLKLDIAQEEDFPVLIAAEWHAFENPLQPIFRLYCPIINNDRAQSIADYTARHLADRKPQQDGDRKTESQWTKVIDSDTDVIVGGAQWIFITEPSVFVEHDDSVSSLAARHPEGGARIFATQAFKVLVEAEAKNRIKQSEECPYRYASLGTCFTIPAYRHNGVGDLLMQSGLKRVDERGMDAWIEAAPSAVPFYKRHGFVQKDIIQLDPRQPEGLARKEAEEWDAAARNTLPVGVCIMYRPARNDCVMSD
ncbi:hypothetical protein BDV29DRAFT_71297 [Aspergillus leporis]|uniref:N-acetyltransferase domain-containing protein n=1 Tax=Aspergillus leporis TaxID=41062 RepID=A0A5N5WIP0_9EURO|nr:hypothetical protein BDV29DRAFT_71297 [Aspergillus leporis]